MTEKSRQYTDEELAALHATLHEILGEIIRVCKLLGIDYFIQGGTAIGAHFYQDIIPWDDDIDIGMTRDNYNRFLKEAPAVLQPQYFLAWYKTDPATPIYFAKLRKRSTRFVEQGYGHIPMHHGIYVDIFPFDRVPDNLRIQRIHRKICNALNAFYMSKSYWPWRYLHHCDKEQPEKMGAVGCIVTLAARTLLPKSLLYRWLSTAQAWFNNTQTTYYNMVLMPRDHIEVESIEHPQVMKFGPHEVMAPSNLETYLRRHYPNLRPVLPKEEQVNHTPEELSFCTGESEA